MKQFFLLIVVTLVVLILFGCTEKYPNKTSSSTPTLAQSNCEGCHLDKEVLQQVADPLPPDTSGGDSGEG
jgi:hypothetical protein